METESEVPGFFWKELKTVKEQAVISPFKSAAGLAVTNRVPFKSFTIKKAPKHTLRAGHFCYTSILEGTQNKLMSF